MPIATSPNATTDFVLACDMERPRAVRPALLVRFMKPPEKDRWAELRQQAIDAPIDDAGNSACFELMCQAIGVAIVGARNYVDIEGKPLAFDAAKIPDFVQQSGLTDAELWEIVNNYPGRVEITGRDRFLSPSTGASTGAGCAPVATPTAAA